MNEFELSVSETTVDDLLVNLINNYEQYNNKFKRIRTRNLIKP